MSGFVSAHTGVERREGARGVPTGRGWACPGLCVVAGCPTPPQAARPQDLCGAPGSEDGGHAAQGPLVSRSLPSGGGAQRGPQARARPRSPAGGPGPPGGRGGDGRAGLRVERGQAQMRAAPALPSAPSLAAAPQQAGRAPAPQPVLRRGRGLRALPWGPHPTGLLTRLYDSPSEFSPGGCGARKGQTIPPVPCAPRGDPPLQGPRPPSSRGRAAGILDRTPRPLGSLSLS